MRSNDLTCLYLMILLLLLLLLLLQVTLRESIRYTVGDPVEKWLNDVLCLDATESIKRVTSGHPDPRKCELYHVNRDSLFSSHPASENFLQRIVSIYVSAHYKVGRRQGVAGLIHVHVIGHIKTITLYKAVKKKY